MKWLKRKIKTIRWMLKTNLLWFDDGMVRSKKRLDFVKQQTIMEKEKRMFKFISKHAHNRLKERMLFRWYTMEDIHKDIVESNERYKRKSGTKIIWKLWTYVISHAGNLITVI